MGIVASDYVVKKILEALGIEMGPDYAVIIRLVANEPAIVEIIKYGTAELEDFDWSILKDAKIKRKDLADVS